MIALRNKIRRKRALQITLLSILVICSPYALKGQKTKQKAGQKKAEGIGITALPFLNYNDDLGAVYGARLIGTYYESNHSPYRYRFWAEYLNSSLSYEKHSVFFEYLTKDNATIKVEQGYKKNIVARYYGSGNFQDIRRIQRTIGEEDPPLAIGPNILREEQDPLGLSSDEIIDSQDRYYSYDYRNSYLETSYETWLAPKNLKVLVGLIKQSYRINSFYNKTESGNIEPNIPTYIDIHQPLGYDAVIDDEPKSINLLRFALAFDSRPRKENLSPSSGIFTDIHYENSSENISSNYDYSNLSFTWRHYLEISPAFWKKQKMKSIFAYRVLARNTSSGTVPFFEEGKIRSINETTEGVGGVHGVRGYPSNQFVDKFITIANFELRHSFLQSEIFGYSEFQALIFYDIGRVAPSRGEWEAKDFHAAYGLGGSMFWHKKSIIQVFFGFSEFHSYTSLNLSHSF